MKLRVWPRLRPPSHGLSVVSERATARQRLEERVVVGPHDDVADQREFEALGDDSQLSQERAAILAARKQIALVTGARREVIDPLVKSLRDFKMPVRCAAAAVALV